MGRRVGQNADKNRQGKGIQCLQTSTDFKTGRTVLQSVTNCDSDANWLQLAFVDDD